MIVNLPQVLTALCVPILTGTWAAIWRMYRRYQSTQDGMKCLLRAEIIRDHSHYMEKGYIPIYAMENVLESYAAYHSLGGNGTITKMVEELKQLPTLRGGKKPWISMEIHGFRAFLVYLADRVSRMVSKIFWMTLCSFSSSVLSRC